MNGNNLKLDVWLYSSDCYEDNLEMDLDLFNSLDRAHPRISFIAPASEHLDEEIQHFKKRFNRIGFSNFRAMSADSEKFRSALLKSMNSDVIYLGGGNTYHFLYHLIRSKCLGLLRQFALEGGVLAGSSAGAIILTPNIDSAGYPDFDCDDNSIGLVATDALSFVEFEFFPHYLPTARYITALKAKSEEKHLPIYAVPDGGGIRVKNGRITFYGDCKVFYDGKLVPLFAT